VRALDGDGPLLAVDAEGELTVGADRRVVLRYLEVLREVWVVVVLPVKARLLGNLGVDCLSHLHGRLDGPLVQHRQRAGKTETGRAGPAVGRLVGRGVGRAAAENLRRRLQLDVDLESDDGREVALGGLCGHYSTVRGRTL